MIIYNFENVEESGLYYGGQAGLKLGVYIDDEPWMLKFPGNIKHMHKVDLSYSSAPVSEYLGSHIFDVLGFPVQETRVGIKNNKIVVACKDFRPEGTELIEYRELKNYYNASIEKELDKTISNTSNHGTNLTAALIHFEYNPIFKKIPSLEDRFWETSLVDILINNSDRNSGNWGILLDRKNKEYSIAPVYDNGGSFYNKRSDNTFAKYLADQAMCKNVSLNCRTSYFIDGHTVSAQKLLSLDIPRLKNAIIKMIPITLSKLDAIGQIVDDIPNEYVDLPILGPHAKEFYKQSMMFRFVNLLYPHYLEICRERKIKPIRLPQPKNKNGKFGLND